MSNLRFVAAAFGLAFMVRYAMDGAIASLFAQALVTGVAMAIIPAR